MQDIPRPGKPPEVSSSGLVADGVSNNRRAETSVQLLYTMIVRLITKSMVLMVVFIGSLVVETPILVSIATVAKSRASTVMALFVVRASR